MSPRHPRPNGRGRASSTGWRIALPYRTERDDPHVDHDCQDDGRPGSRYAYGDTDRDPAGQQEELHPAPVCPLRPPTAACGA
jgi:hypothetical protein